MRTLTGVLPSGTVMGVKQFCFPRGRKVRYMISLFDQDSGELLALLDANTITALRTGATTAMAIDRMAPLGKARVAMLGSGAEARAHARAIAAVRPIESLAVYSPTPARREAFARHVRDEIGRAGKGTRPHRRAWRSRAPRHRVGANPHARRQAGARRRVARARDAGCLHWRDLA